MTDLQTRILEVESDDDTGRLARALEAVTKECARLKKVANNTAQRTHNVSRSIAITQSADSVLEVLQESLGAGR